MYAKRDLEAGTLIGKYAGELLTLEEHENSKSSGLYAMCLATGDVLDGEEEARSNFLRFINHSKAKANCEAEDAFYENEFLFGISCNAVSIATKRDIAAGEELLFDYGTSYWDELVPRFTPKRIAIDYF